MNVVNNVDMSSLRAPWQNGPYTEKHTEQHGAPRGNILFLYSEEIFQDYKCLFLRISTKRAV